MTIVWSVARTGTTVSTFNLCRDRNPAGVRPSPGPTPSVCVSVSEHSVTLLTTICCIVKREKPQRKVRFQDRPLSTEGCLWELVGQLEESILGLS